MAASEQDLQDRVRRRLDQLSSGGNQDLDTTLVRDELEAATRSVVQAVPASLLFSVARNVAASATLTEKSVVVSDDLTVQYARVTLGADALRILQAKLSDWLTPVSDGAIADGFGEAYEAYLTGEQCATTRRPAAFQTVSASADAGSVALDCFPYDADEPSTVSELLIVPATLTPATAPAALIDPIVWAAVAAIAGTYLQEPGALAAANAKASESLESAIQDVMRLAPRPRHERLSNRSANTLG